MFIMNADEFFAKLLAQVNNYECESRYAAMRCKIHAATSWEDRMRLFSEYDAQSTYSGGESIYTLLLRGIKYDDERVREMLSAANVFTLLETPGNFGERLKIWNCRKRLRFDTMLAREIEKRGLFPVYFEIMKRFSVLHLIPLSALLSVYQISDEMHAVLLTNHNDYARRNALAATEGKQCLYVWKDSFDENPDVTRCVIASSFEEAKHIALDADCSFCSNVIEHDHCILHTIQYEMPIVCEIGVNFVMDV